MFGKGWGGSIEIILIAFSIGEKPPKQNDKNKIWHRYYVESRELFDWTFVYKFELMPELS